MTVFRSQHWDENGGSCKKHGTTGTPCSECIATRDPDLEVHLSEEERRTLNNEPNPNLRSLFPAGDDGDWLMTQLIC